jgi:hypothetical protein
MYGVFDANVAQTMPRACSGATVRLKQCCALGSRVVTVPGVGSLAKWEFSMATDANAEAAGN